MKRSAAILLALVMVSGCGWFGKWFSRKDRVIYPDEEAPPAARAQTQARPVEPAPTSVPAPVVTAPAASEVEPAHPPAPPRTRPAEPEVRPVGPLEPYLPQPATRPAPASSPTTYRVIGQPEIISAAVIQVNDRFITLDQVLHPIHAKLQAAAREGMRERFLLQALTLIQEQVQRQVEETLMLAEAEDRLDEQVKKAVGEEVHARVRQAVADAGGSRSQLEDRLREEGTDLDAWTEEVRRALMVQAYAARRFGDHIVINRRMMWDYYNAHRADFRTPEKVRMQVIAAPFRSFLPTTRPATPTDYFEGGKAARRQIDSAAAALAEGKDFADVARAFSRDVMAGEGGTWPPLERGSFRAAEVEQAAFAQKPGQVSGVVEARDGYYIVKTLEVLPPREQSFEDAQPRIENELRRQQYDQLTHEYLEKMRSRTTLQAVDRFEQTALEVVERRYLRGPP